MFDGFWSGIFGGLFGPAFAQWLSKFKYGVIFLIAVLASELFFLSLAIYYRGWIGLSNIFTHDISSFVIIFICAPLGIGVFGMFISFLGSLNTQKKPERDKD